MIGKLIRAMLGGLLLAGFVHVAALLMIPGMAPRDAVSRVGEIAPTGTMVPVAADGSLLPDLDPYFTHAVCAFDLAEGPYAIAGPMPDTLWTVAVVSKTGGIGTSLERSGAIGNRLDLVVGRPGSVEQIRLARAPDAVTGTAYAAVGSDLGFILIRAFVDEADRRDDIADTLAALDCGPIPE